MKSIAIAALIGVGLMTALVSAADDREIVASLDREYQAAVKQNDAETMGRILHDDFVLVLGNGTTLTRDDLLAEARAGGYQYEKQDEIEDTQTVRVWNDTAVVTAKLWIKGVHNGEPFDRTLWFSDTYIRTSGGWRYVFGQASLPLPAAQSGFVLPVPKKNLADFSTVAIPGATSAFSGSACCGPSPAVSPLPVDARGPASELRK
jgi:ketosteroid isomerase-like protein